MKQSCSKQRHGHAEPRVRLRCRPGAAPAGRGSCAPRSRPRRRGWGRRTGWLGRRSTAAPGLWGAGNASGFLGNADRRKDSDKHRERGQESAAGGKDSEAAGCAARQLSCASGAAMPRAPTEAPRSPQCTACCTRQRRQPRRDTHSDSHPLPPRQKQPTAPASPQRPAP